MRWLVGVCVIAFAIPAGAEEPRLWIAPVKAACVDDVQLVDLLRRELRGVDVTGGSRPLHGARDEVRISRDEAGLLVRVDTMDAAERVLASEMRVVPTSGDCEAQRAMVVIVIARAVTPLQFRSAPRPEPARPRPAPEHRAAPEAPVHGGAPEGTADRTPDWTPAPDRTPAPPATPREPPLPPPITGAPPTPMVIVHSPAPWRPTRPVRRAHPVELSLDGNWMFPVDGAPSVGGGDIGLGYGWTWVGVGLRAGVAAPSTITASGMSTVSIETRRIPLALDAWVDLPLRRGAFRVSVGPEIVLWHVHANGVPDADDALVVQPAAEARVAYRIEIKRFTVGAGVEANVAFLRDVLSVRGVGEVGKLPIGAFSPFVVVAGRP